MASSELADAAKGACAVEQTAAVGSGCLSAGACRKRSPEVIKQDTNCPDKILLAQLSSNAPIVHIKSC
eukprot:4077066-Pleurochrysis_carterae.AAC.1